MRSRSSLVSVSKGQQKTHLEHTEEAPLLLTVDAAAIQNLSAFSAAGAMSLATNAPSAKEPATKAEKVSMAACPCSRGLTRPNRGQRP